jgi:ABC-type transport system involved in cytochrome bd biosynthesis fused ATPase/permease subunit
MDSQVRQALRKLTQNRTTFIVTHRLRTAEEADLVMMMENGKIVEIGPHEELVRGRGSYAKLYADSINNMTEEMDEPYFDPPTPPPGELDGAANSDVQPA